MKRIIFLFSLLLILPNLIIAQAQEAGDADFPLSSIAIQGAGILMDASLESQVENFKKLAPESEILKENLNSYSKSGDIYNQSSYAFGIYTALPLRSQKYKRLNPKIRFGIQFIENGSMRYDLSKTDYYRIDTLAGGNGQTYFVDSLVYQYIEMDYLQNQIHLDAALMLSSNETSRWAVKGGLGMSFGFTYKARTNIQYSLGNDYELGVPINYAPTVYEYQEENFSNDLGVAFMTYIPFILDFRIARRGKFFSRAHLYWEGRPFLYYTMIPEINNELQSGFSSAFGFRYELK